MTGKDLYEAIHQCKDEYIEKTAERIEKNLEKKGLSPTFPERMDPPPVETQRRLPDSGRCPAVYCDIGNECIGPGNGVGCLPGVAV